MQFSKALFFLLSKIIRIINYSRGLQFRLNVFEVVEVTRIFNRILVPLYWLDQEYGLIHWLVEIFCNLKITIHLIFFFILVNIIFTCLYSSEFSSTLMIPTVTGNWVFNSSKLISFCWFISHVFIDLIRILIHLNLFLFVGLFPMFLGKY